MAMLTKCPDDSTRSTRSRCGLFSLLCSSAAESALRSRRFPPPRTKRRSRDAAAEFSGKVEFAAAGAAEWQPAKPGQLLHPGDRLRTQADSRAALRLSDRSVIRVNQLTVLEIQLPSGPSARKRFKLQRGSILFPNREEPSDIEFETPLATGAIRGTEFLLTAGDADGVTLLALLDGAVELKSAGETLSLSAGQQALVRPGDRPRSPRPCL